VLRAPVDIHQDCAVLQGELQCICLDAEISFVKQQTNKQYSDTHFPRYKTDCSRLGSLKHKSLFYEPRQIRITLADLMLTLSFVVNQRQLVALLQGNTTNDRHWHHIEVRPLMYLTFVATHLNIQHVRSVPCFSSRPNEVQALVRNKGNSNGICGVRSSTGTCFPPSTLAFPHHYHSSNTVILSTTLYLSYQLGALFSTLTTWAVSTCSKFRGALWTPRLLYYCAKFFQKIKIIHTHIFSVRIKAPADKDSSVITSRSTMYTNVHHPHRQDELQTLVTPELKHGIPEVLCNFWWQWISMISSEGAKCLSHCGIPKAGRHKLQLRSEFWTLSSISIIDVKTHCSQIYVMMHCSWRNVKRP
jgi:hypothetical protein